MLPFLGKGRPLKIHQIPAIFNAKSPGKSAKNLRSALDSREGILATLIIYVRRNLVLEYISKLRTSKNTFDVLELNMSVMLGNPGDC